MKKIYCSIIFSLIFLSCRQELLQYSCDPVLNEIVTSHIQEYVQYTVTDVIVYDLHAQQAIFRTYTPEKKREIWLEKIHFLLENENYTNEEYIHITKLLDHLSENYFNADTIKATTLKRAQFNAAWISVAKNNFGWTDRYIAFVIYRLYNKQLQLDAETKILQSLKQKAIADGETISCDCNQTNNYCDDYIRCNAYSCEPKGGCGVFWGEDCNGSCF